MNKLIIGCIIFLLIYIISFEINKRKVARKKEIIQKFEKEEKIKKLGELREKFKNDLIGRWVSCQGTFDMIMNEEWVFNQDGSGFMISRSISTEEEKEEFFWRKNSDRCIDIKLEDGDWCPRCYDFCLTATDCGFFPTLVELDANNNPRKGFGIFEIPLVYSSDTN